MIQREALTGQTAVSQATIRDEVFRWDAGNWSRALDFWRSRTRVRLDGAQVLELGAFHGGLSLWFALQGAEVVCSDVKAPSAVARELHARWGVASRVRYETIDAAEIPYTAAFDVVCFKSVLGHVGMHGRRDRQELALRRMREALRAGGELWFAENLAASPLHRLARRWFVKWGRAWRYVARDELPALLRDFSGCDLETVGFAGAFGRSEGQRRALAVADRLALEHLVPPAWRYVAMGVARR